MWLKVAFKHPLIHYICVAPDEPMAATLAGSGAMDGKENPTKLGPCMTRS